MASMCSAAGSRSTTRAAFWSARIGVSGDTSCADHNIAWRTRNNLNMDFVPAGPGPAGKEDNINYQGAVPVPSLQNDFSHPTCPIAGVDTASAISAALPNTK